MPSKAPVPAGPLADPPEEPIPRREAVGPVVPTETTHLYSEDRERPAMGRLPAQDAVQRRMVQQARDGVPSARGVLRSFERGAETAPEIQAQHQLTHHAQEGQGIDDRRVSGVDQADDQEHQRHRGHEVAD